MSTVLLELENVTKNFGALTAVNHVSFSLNEGEVLGIMGPNGAGKTTLLNLIMGVFPLDGGEIRFAGERITGLPTNAISRRGIGRTFQIPQPFKRMTVIENLLVGELYGGSYQGIRAARKNAMEILERLGLLAKANMVAGQLGLLDLKRLELARALSLRPQLLLLDEIAAGLVESEVVQLERLITDLKFAGQTMIIIEHVLSVMFDHSDRIMVLDFGEPIAEGIPEDIAQDPRVIEVYLGAQETEERQPSVPATESQENGRSSLLKMSRVNAAYGDFQALFDISMEIYEAEILALIGLNGAGKTTLIRTITRQIPLISGELTFRGHSILDARPHDIVELGIAQCMEGRKIFPHLTVRENLEMGAYSRRARAYRHATIRRVYDLFPILADRSSQPGGTLSGGEQQMLAIGRALMALPSLIIFDEISLGLAPLIINSLYETVLDINRQGTTILLVEQNVHRSLSIAHRAYIIERGRVVLSGSAEDLRQNPDVQSVYFGLDTAS